jgi:hypothetical protein
MIITWTIKPLNTPAILRNCSHCGCQREFLCDNNFRINAQQKKLDVWLIYKCKTCNCTWNMDIFSRVRPDDLGRELYDGFLNNSAELAYKYAFDLETLAKNKARACYNDVQFVIEGDDITADYLKCSEVTLQINSQFNLQVRLDKILNEKLGISRNCLNRLFKSGAIKCDNTCNRNDISKIKIKGDATLQFDLSVIKNLTEEKMDDKNKEAEV